jgi:poly(3-hydroxyalkanoate) synthetase
VRFVVDRGIPEIAIGTKSARITWENPGEGAVEGWQDLVALVDFLEAREIRAPLLDREGAVAQTLEEHLARISDLLQPHCDAVFEFVRSAMFEQRRAEFARFLENRNEEILRQIRERFPGQV